MEVAAEAAAELVEASARVEAAAGGAAAAGSGGADAGGAPTGLELVRVPLAAEPTAADEDEEMDVLNDEWADTAPARRVQPPPAGPASRRAALLAALAASPAFSIAPAETWAGRTAEELEQLAPWLQEELAALGPAPRAPGQLGAVGASAESA